MQYRPLVLSQSLCRRTGRRLLFLVIPMLIALLWGFGSLSRLSSHSLVAHEPAFAFRAQLEASRGRPSEPLRNMKLSPLPSVILPVLDRQHSPESTGWGANVSPLALPQEKATSAPASISPSSPTAVQQPQPPLALPDDSNDPALTLMRRFRVKSSPAPSPDYLDPIFDSEALSQSAAAATTVKTSFNPRAAQSIQLMSRPGHRYRVSDLIGGKHMSPSELRALLNNTHVFKMAKAGSDDPTKSGPSRDYATSPILISHPTSECPVVPCQTCSSSTCDSRGVAFSMENVPITSPAPGDDFRIAGNTRLTSRIPVPYFSWHDFGLMLPPLQKDRLGGAFISNCGFQKRNDMVTKLRFFTANRVHSYGGCVHTDAERGSRGQHSKISTLQMHKFVSRLPGIQSADDSKSMAFENSETVDYVTEKFFQSLVAGSVPVVIGAPNVKFRPDTGPYPYESSSLIQVSDYGDNAEVVAKMLLAFDQDDEAYNRTLAWKYTGYSDDFKAMMDLTDMHSSCRSCVSLGDERRHTFGSNVYDMRELKEVEADPGGGSFSVFVRERGSYSWHRLKFNGRPGGMFELVDAILKYVPVRPKNLWKDNATKRPKPTRVYAVYAPTKRLPVLTTGDLQSLPQDAELEVIFV